MGHISQDDAEYRPISDSAESCSTCEHFLGENTCEVVGGVISPEGISAYWTAEEGSAAMSSEVEHGPAVVKLGRVVVPPYLRQKDGKIEDVEGYTYTRQGTVTHLMEQHGRASSVNRLNKSQLQGMHDFYHSGKAKVEGMPTGMTVKHSHGPKLPDVTHQRMESRVQTFAKNRPSLPLPDTQDQVKVQLLEAAGFKRGIESDPGAEYWSKDVGGYRIEASFGTARSPVRPGEWSVSTHKIYPKSNKPGDEYRGLLDDAFGATGTTPGELADALDEVMGWIGTALGRKARKASLSAPEDGPAVAKLARVVVPPYLREKSGHIEDVEGYTYDREGATLRHGDRVLIAPKQGLVSLPGLGRVVGGYRDRVKVKMDNGPETDVPGNLVVRQDVEGYTYNRSGAPLPPIDRLPIPDLKKQLSKITGVPADQLPKVPGEPGFKDKYSYESVKATLDPVARAEAERVAKEQGGTVHELGDGFAVNIPDEPGYIRQMVYRGDFQHYRATGEIRVTSAFQGKFPSSEFTDKLGRFKMTERYKAPPRTASFQRKRY